MVCLAELSALSHVKGRAVARQGSEACALSEVWCLTICLGSDRPGIRLVTAGDVTLILPFRGPFVTGVTGLAQPVTPVTRHVSAAQRARMTRHSGVTGVTGSRLRCDGLETALCCPSWSSLGEGPPRRLGMREPRSSAALRSEAATQAA